MYICGIIGGIAIALALAACIVNVIDAIKFVLSGEHEYED